MHGKTFIQRTFFDKILFTDAIEAHNHVLIAKLPRVTLTGSVMNDQQSAKKCYRILKIFFGSIQNILSVILELLLWSFIDRLETFMQEVKNITLPCPAWKTNFERIQKDSVVYFFIYAERYWRRITVFETHCYLQRVKFLVSGSCKQAKLQIRRL